MAPIVSLWWWLAVANAQDALTMSAVRYAQDGLSTASVTFHPRVDGEIDVALACGARNYTLKTRIDAGKEQTIALEGLPKGSHRCTGRLALSAADGTSGEMPLSIGVEVLPALALDARRDELDLSARRLVVRASRPIARAEVEVLGEGGAVIGRGEATSAPTDALSLSWSASGGEVLKLVVTAWDAHELPGKLELSPWSYAIPHEDVVFDTASSDIGASEAPKLEHAWVELERVLARYGSVVKVNLYVAGYTDTVGRPDYNRGLSEARAKAIAAWFRSRGFRGEIRYQGFGEAGLAVATGDETPEARNRRALYILAAEQPPISAEIPRSEWKKLD